MLDVLVARIAPGFSAARVFAERAFRLRILEDRSITMSAPDPGRLDVRLEPRGHFRGLGWVAGTLAKEFLCARERGLHVFHLAVLERDREAARGAPGGDVAAHDSGADDVDVRHLARRLAAKRLHAVLQEEDADQVPRLVAEEEPRDRTCLGLKSSRPGGAVPLKEIEDRVGRRVVFRVRAAGDLLSRLRGHEGSN